mgnify:CR=1 FL=1
MSDRDSRDNNEQSENRGHGGGRRFHKGGSHKRHGGGHRRHSGEGRGGYRKREDREGVPSGNAEMEDFSEEVRAEEAPTAEQPIDSSGVAAGEAPAQPQPPKSVKILQMKDLKAKKPHELAELATSMGVENAAGLRKQEAIFHILQATASGDYAVFSDGVLECLPDGYGFLRSPDYNYLPGPDDIYVSPSQIRRFGLRTDRKSTRLNSSH